MPTPRRTVSSSPKRARTEARHSTTVFWFASADGGQAIEIRVLDNGPGLAEEDIEHLFDLFYRSPLTEKKAPGAGIGLFVSNHLAQAMGGRLWAGNRPEGEMDELFRRELVRDTELLGRAPYAGKVGAFEGANYEARGFYRPQSDCIMFTRDEVPFCAVCQRAIVEILDLYSR